MQIMFIWILIIIYWNFLNSIVNMANFWERLMMEEEEMLTWTEIQRKLWSPVLESKDYCLFSFLLRQLSSPHSLRQTLCLSCWCFPCCTDRTSSTHCLWLHVSPCPRHRGCCSAEPGWVQPWRAETGEKHWSRLRGGRRRPSVLGGSVWLGLLKPGCSGCPRFAIPDAETHVVKMFHICQFTELRWSNKDADMPVVC